MLFVDNKYIDISIIIPLYKGAKYIDRLMQMITDNYLYKELYKGCKLEVIFVNDFPEQDIEIQENFFSVRVITNCENQGIHKTRVNGIAQARGEYAIMLDQDDLIKTNYLYSQWEMIKSNNADFCVCKGWRSRFRTIGNVKNFEAQINDLGYYFTSGNPIMSPGQVILRKKSIPEEWKENILHRNGADDCFLWMLILLTGKKFIVNEEFLFYHTPERTNDSITSNAMTASLEEMRQILKKIGYLSEIREKQIEQQLMERDLINGKMPDISYSVSAQSVQKVIHITKFRKMFLLLLDWSSLNCEGKCIVNYLRKCGYHSVAIHGMGYIGEMLYRELKNSSIEVKYAIDRSALDFEDELNIIKIDDEFPDVDLVISTVLDETGDLMKQLKMKSKCRVLGIGEVLNEIKQI